MMFANLKSPLLLWQVSFGLVFIQYLRHVSCLLGTSTVEMASHGAECAEHLSANGMDTKPMADLEKQTEKPRFDDSRSRTTLAESVPQERPAAALAGFHHAQFADATKVSFPAQNQQFSPRTLLGGMVPGIIRPGYPNPLLGPPYSGFRNKMTPLTEANIFKRHWLLLGEQLLRKEPEKRKFHLENIQKYMYENVRLEQSGQTNFHHEVPNQFHGQRDHPTECISSNRRNHETKRKKSDLELIEIQEILKRERKQQCQICDDTSHRTRDCDFQKLPYVEHLIPKMVPFIKEVLDTEPDGNCGFRAVAICLGRNENEFHKIRMEILFEMRKNENFYRARAECNTQNGYDATIESLMADNGPVEEDKWMLMPSLGDAIANTYERPVYFYSKKGSFTFLPQYAEIRKVPSIFFAAVKSDHYVTLEMHPHTIPTPPLVPNWDEHASETAKIWREAISKNLKLWKWMMGPSRDKGPPEPQDVIELND